jgi:hypothetical protein
MKAAGRASAPHGASHCNQAGRARRDFWLAGGIRAHAMSWPDQAAWHSFTC